MTSGFSRYFLQFYRCSPTARVPSSRAHGPHRGYMNFVCTCQPLMTAFVMNHDGCAASRRCPVPCSLIVYQPADPFPRPFKQHLWPPCAWCRMTDATGHNTHSPHALQRSNSSGSIAAPSFLVDSHMVHTLSYRDHEALLLAFNTRHTVSPGSYGRGGCCTCAQRVEPLTWNARWLANITAKRAQRDGRARHTSSPLSVRPQYACA